MSVEEFVGWFLWAATSDAVKNRPLDMTEEQDEAIDNYRELFFHWRTS